MSFRFSTDLSRPRITTGTPTGWALVVVVALLPFTVAYVVAGFNPDIDVQLIAALVGLLVLVMAVVVNIAAAAIRKLRRNASNDHWVY